MISSPAAAIEQIIIARLGSRVSYHSTSEALLHLECYYHTPRFGFWETRAIELAPVVKVHLSAGVALLSKPCFSQRRLC